MFIETGQFIDGRLRDFVNGRQSLSALVASHGPVGFLSKGTTNIRDSRLEITVLSGMHGTTAPPLYAFALVVVFLGSTEFEESLEFIRLLRLQNPQCTLVAVTCDCNLTSKGDAVEPLLQSRDINTAILTRQCGGKDEMGEIVQGILDSWSTRTRS